MEGYDCTGLEKQTIKGGKVAATCSKSVTLCTGTLRTVAVCLLCNEKYAALSLQQSFVRG